MNRFLKKVDELTKHFGVVIGWGEVHTDWSGSYHIQDENHEDKEVFSFYDFQEFYEKANEILKGEENGK